MVGTFSWPDGGSVAEGSSGSEWNGSQSGQGASDLLLPRPALGEMQGQLACGAARGEIVQPDAVLEVAYRILDLGVAAVVSLQFEHLPVPVGDEAVIAVGGEEGQLRTGRRLHPPDDEPYRCGAGLSPEGGVETVSEQRPELTGQGAHQLDQANPRRRRRNLRAWTDRTVRRRHTSVESSVPSPHRRSGTSDRWPPAANRPDRAGPGRRQNPWRGESSA